MKSLFHKIKAAQKLHAEDGGDTRWKDPGPLNHCLEEKPLCPCQKKSGMLWLEIDDKDLLKGLMVCKAEAQPDNSQSVLKEKEKSEVLLRRIISVFLAHGIVHYGILNDLSSGLDSGTFSLRPFRWLTGCLVYDQALTSNTLMCIQVLM